MFKLCSEVFGGVGISKFVTEDATLRMTSLGPWNYLNFSKLRRTTPIPSPSLTIAASLTVPTFLYFTGMARAHRLGAITSCFAAIYLLIFFQILSVPFVSDTAIQEILPVVSRSRALLADID